MIAVHVVAAVKGLQLNKLPSVALPGFSLPAGAPPACLLSGALAGTRAPRVTVAAARGAPLLRDVSPP